MKLPVYYKDESGLINFRGIQSWKNIKQLLTFYCVDDYPPIEVNMVGWNHTKVVWYNNIGIGIQ